MGQSSAAAAAVPVATVLRTVAAERLARLSSPAFDTIHAPARQARAMTDGTIRPSVLPPNDVDQLVHENSPDQRLTLTVCGCRRCTRSDGRPDCCRLPPVAGERLARLSSPAFDTIHTPARQARAMTDGIIRPSVLPPNDVDQLVHENSPDQRRTLTVGGCRRCTRSEGHAGAKPER